jgi:lysophospholipase L1-like esterase
MRSCRDSTCLSRMLAAAIALGCALTRPAIADAPAVPAPSPPPAAAPAASAALATKRAYVVAAMGDSLTDARSHGGKYLDVLRRHCPESRFDNYGKGGQMVNQMRKRFARDVLGEPKVPGADKPRYTHVIVFGGVNDLYSDLTAGRTVAKIEADLGHMYQAAKQRGIRVVALTVSPWGGFSHYYNSSRAATTHELNRWLLARPQAGEVDSVIDTFLLLSCGDPERLCPAFTAPFNDGLHFNEGGHQKVGELLYQHVFADCR